MDDAIFSDGNRHLKISVAGINPQSNTVSAEEFRLTLYAFEKHPVVQSLFTAELDIS